MSSFSSAFSSAFDVATTRRGNWFTLVAALDEAREIDRQEATQPPVECPNDYTPLQSTADGKLFCPWDGWLWPDQA